MEWVALAMWTKVWEQRCCNHVPVFVHEKLKDIKMPQNGQKVREPKLQEEREQIMKATAAWPSPIPNELRINSLQKISCSRRLSFCHWGFNYTLPAGVWIERFRGCFLASEQNLSQQIKVGKTEVNSPVLSLSYQKWAFCIQKRGFRRFPRQRGI